MTFKEKRIKVVIRKINDLEDELNDQPQHERDTSYWEYHLMDEINYWEDILEKLS